MQKIVRVYSPATRSDLTGFTLVEVSIVLTIITLIVGGALIGRDLIRSAEVRATVSQQQQFSSAANTFQVKYNTVPGDLTTAQATRLGFAPAARNNPGSIHGNGLIED